MKSKVYFTKFNEELSAENKTDNFQKLFDTSKIVKNIESNDDIAIKMDFNDKNTKKTEYVKKIIQTLPPVNSNIFLTDTTDIYPEYKRKSITYLNNIFSNNSEYNLLSTPIIISDGLNGNNERELIKENNHNPKIANDIYESDCLIMLNDIKINEIIGLSGSLKNLAINCASKNGKISQYQLAQPFISKIRCLACKVCENECLENAIVVNSHAVINKDKCIGCNYCIDKCPTHTIKLNTLNTDKLTEVMSQYAYCVIENKIFNKIIYINFLTNITLDYSYNNMDDRQIVNDIGILLSYDPVAIDKASVDLINKSVGNPDSPLINNHENGKDKFKGIRRNLDSTLLIEQAEKLRLGTQDYELIEI